MEVLIGTFVLSVGLLGLAALIPIGRFAIVETGKADRSGACGRAGLREIRVQRMLDPTTWRDVALAPVIDTTTTPPQFRDDPMTGDPAAAFAIDPMQIARANADGNVTAVGRFPYGAVAANLSMPRITLESVLAKDYAVNPPTLTLSLPLANRSFVWRDELLFEMPEDATWRPRRQVRNTANSEYGPYPKLPSDEVDFPAGTPLVPQTDENYSWMVTVTPACVENHMSPTARKLYSVSVVVFWKRDYTVDTSERIVGAEIFGGGYGGGDVRLHDSRATKLDVKEDQWMMLCGQVKPNNFPVFQWYRVISAAELDGNDRFVTLAGPDWRTAWCTGPGNETQAVLLDRVIGVYTTTVELDRDLMWTR